MSKITKMFVKFQCTNKDCAKVEEILHQVEPWLDPPKCECGSVREPVMTGETQECNVAFRGLSTPGSSTSRIPKLDKKINDTWHQRRINQVKKTGK